jgi:hypothetical protein
MPWGSFDLDSATPPLANDVWPISVCRYTPASSAPYSLLPNVRCLQIDFREGPDPPTARFTYIMDDDLTANYGWPSQFEELWPIDAQGPYIVKSDDRIVVLVTNPDNSYEVLFDGFAQIPQVDLSSSSQHVTFAAVSVAIREFDSPISGRVQRNSDPVGVHDTSGDSDIETDLPTRFNPADTDSGNKGGFLPNKTPPNQDTGQGTPKAYPVFADPNVNAVRFPGEVLSGFWSVSDAIKYILLQYNPNQTYTSYPTLSTLDSLLVSEFPVDPDAIGPFDPPFVNSAPILIRDYDASNKPWPEAVSELLGYAGFVMRWQITTNSVTEFPLTTMAIYRRDAAAATIAKLLYLDQSGSQLNPSRNNVSAAHLARDCNAIVNAWKVETNQRQVEVSIILSPLYIPIGSDASAANRKGFSRSSWTVATSAATKRAYRWYGADECGDGHYDFFQGGWFTTPFNFGEVFPPDDNGNPTYTVRYRPGSHTVIAVGADGEPLKAELAISFNYPLATAPSLYLTGGTWQTIAHGWKLLDDRLGIEVTIEDPEEWSLGKGSAIGAGAPTIPGGQIRGITWWANPPTTAPTYGSAPVLRLTTVIEDDLRLSITAQKRIASPTVYPRFRVADARDHFQYTAIDPSSANYTGDGTNPQVIIDDTAAALTHAYQLRSAHEMPPLAGSITLPFVTDYYEIGDRVRSISGRNANLGISIGMSQGETPTYPWIVGVSWLFEPNAQRTTLQLTDRRAEPRNAR